MKIKTSIQINKSFSLLSVPRINADVGTNVVNVVNVKSDFSPFAPRRMGKNDESDAPQAFPSVKNELAKKSPISILSGRTFAKVVRVGKGIPFGQGKMGKFAAACFLQADDSIIGEKGLDR